jgi:hypothetical protein
MAGGVQDRGGGIEDGKDHSTLLMAWPWPCHVILGKVSSQSVMYKSCLCMPGQVRDNQFYLKVVVVKLSVQRLLRSTSKSFTTSD